MYVPKPEGLFKGFIYIRLPYSMELLGVYRVVVDLFAGYLILEGLFRLRYLEFS